MKQIRLKIKSIQRDPEGDELNINIACDGTMEMRGGRIYIKYEEDISGEGDIVENTMSFDTGERDVISLSRIGDAKMSCVFERGKRYPCNYELPFGAFELVVSAKCVDNSVDYEKGGEVYLKYAMESRGIVIQNVKYRLTVEKA